MSREGCEVLVLVYADRFGKGMMGAVEERVREALFE